MGEGKRNNRLQLIEKKEFTDGEEVRGSVKREGSRWHEEEKKLTGMQKYEKAKEGMSLGGKTSREKEKKNTGFSTEHVSRKLAARSPLLRNNSVLHKWLIPSFTPGAAAFLRRQPRTYSQTMPRGDPASRIKK